MTDQTPIDSLKAIVLYLYNHSLWNSAIHIHGAELPAGYALTKSVLVLPEGGASNDDLPIMYDRFTFHSYGTTMYEAKDVDLLIYRILIREKGEVNYTGGGKVKLMYAHRVFGPIPIREPDTEWPRWSSSYDTHLIDYAVT